MDKDGRENYRGCRAGKEGVTELTAWTTSSGYRDYAQDEVQTVERIKLLGSAGMTLAIIQQFLPCVRGEGPILEPCDELRNVLREQIRLADQKAEKLTKSRNILERFLCEIEQG